MSIFFLRISFEYNIGVNIILTLFPLFEFAYINKNARSPHFVLAGSGRPRLSFGRRQSAGPVSWVKQRYLRPLMAASRSCCFE